MSQYCFKTDIGIDPQLRDDLLSYVKNNQHLFATYSKNHDLLTDGDHENGFFFIVIPKDLEDRVLNNIPDWLKPDLNDIFVRVQIVNDARVIHHRDLGRTSSILCMLTDNTAFTNFYSTDATMEPLQLIIDPAVCDRKLSVKFSKDEAWLFDNTSIHSVDFSTGTRITLNILYQTLPFNDLLKLYERNAPLSHSGIATDL